ncbi:MAG: bifunctional 3-demethylubiquinol 3-O-methyltransferase/2-polyprenyl-6-hydroxyphenol methylase, partial [Alphaproteobacteria bacterium]
MPEPLAASSSVDPREVAQFSALAAEFWDPRGKMRMLHRINPLRLRFIRDHACRQFGRDAGRLDCLDGLRILDIGCGGGLLSEPLARLGASVV